MTQTVTQLGYSATVAGLLASAPADDLGTGVPNPVARAALAKLDDLALWDGRPVVDRSMADCCRSGLWLRHHFLDESHQISQGIETPSGSFWHGIMHRREADFGNAKYWFRQVGQHPVYANLAQASSVLTLDAAERAVVNDLLPGKRWDPARFVDLCEAAVRRGGANVALCLKLQAAEWHELFDYCYAAAVGLRRADVVRQP